MYARLAKLHEVHLVFSNLSESFRSELAEASISIEEAQRKLEDCVKSGMALSLLRGDELLALLGYEIDDGIAYTSMPSTPAFFRPDTVRFGKRIMAELQTAAWEYPGHVVQLFFRRESPAVVRVDGVPADPGGGIAAYVSAQPARHRTALMSRSFIQWVCAGGVV
ncbi:hypothetical protein GCM10011385_31600 [Nitratireductor aestuarii]|uniref:Uncharacterized protein n=1 Tax=Nitratireductor aestuarii TaxID=1735103 RepID=A0A916RXI7_9HYPH|nr:hypothetical protein [Nitratireductor aestuarii]GGA75245.1 hypothetical protein GCM10011385_31600 [Nitratireductor aestuarii]